MEFIRFIWNLVLIVVFGIPAILVICISDYFNPKNNDVF